MNFEQAMGQIRTWLAAAIAAYAARHVPPEIISLLPAGWETGVAVFVSGLPIAIWSWWAKRPKAVAAQAVRVLADRPELAREVRAELAGR